MQVPYNLYYGAPIYYPLTKEWSTLSWTHLLSLEQKDYKPDWQLALRGLSDMTEEEQIELFAIKMGKKERVYSFEARRTSYLLSKHFDLFNLI